MYPNDTVEAFHEAVRAGNLQAVMEMLSKGVDVEAADCFSTRPIHIAAGHGHLDILKALIARGCDVNAQASCVTRTGVVVMIWGTTALHLAASKADPKLALALIHAGANVNVQNQSGEYPLHIAAEHGHLTIVKALVNANADVNAQGINTRSRLLYYTPLICAAEKNFEDVAEFLMQNGAVVNASNSSRWTALHSAAKKGNINITKLLIQNKAAVNAKTSKDLSPLHVASQVSVSQFLIDSGAEVNARDKNGYTPLLHAAYRGYPAETVSLLINSGADVNARDIHVNWTPLHFAAGECPQESMEIGQSRAQAEDIKVNTMKALIENGADINAKGIVDETALHIAAKAYDLRAARYLLENGAYYDAKAHSYYGNISLTKNSEGVIKLLDVTDKLFRAVKGAKCAEIDKCIQEGAPVNSRSIKCETPLMYASWKGQLAVVNVLLKNGANVNLSNSNGVTPLHYAAKFGHHEILCALLQQGAVYNAKTKTGKKTPLHFAQEGGKKVVADTLELIERVFIRITESDDTLLKLKDINSAEFLAIKNCKNLNEETLTQMATKNGYDKLCKLLYDL